MEAVTIASIWIQSISLIFRQESEYFSLPSFLTPIKNTFNFIFLLSLPDLEVARYFDRYAYYVNFGFRVGYIATNLLLPLLLCFITLILFKPLNIVISFLSFLLCIFSFVTFTYFLLIHHLTLFNTKYKTINTATTVGVSEWYFLIATFIFFIITLIIFVFSLINSKFGIWKRIPSSGQVISYCIREIKAKFSMQAKAKETPEEMVRKIKVRPRLVSSDSFVSTSKEKLRETIETVPQHLQRKDTIVTEVKNVFDDFEVVVYKEYPVNELKKMMKMEHSFQCTRILITLFYSLLFIVLGSILMGIFGELIGGGVLMLIGILWLIFYSPLLLFRRGRIIVFWVRHHIIEKYGVFLGLVALQFLYTPFLTSIFSSFVCETKSCAPGYRFVTVNSGFSLGSIYKRSSQYCEPCYVFDNSIGANVNISSPGVDSLCPAAQSICPGVSGFRLSSEPTLDCTRDIIPYFWPASILIGLLYSLALPISFFLIVHRSVNILKNMNVRSLLWSNLPAHIRIEAKRMTLRNFLNIKKSFSGIVKRIEARFSKTKVQPDTMIGMWAPDLVRKHGSLSFFIKPKQSIAPTYDNAQNERGRDRNNQDGSKTRARDHISIKTTQERNSTTTGFHFEENRPKKQLNNGHSTRSRDSNSSSHNRNNHKRPKDSNTIAKASGSGIHRRKRSNSTAVSISEVKLLTIDTPDISIKTTIGRSRRDPDKDIDKNHAVKKSIKTNKSNNPTEKIFVTSKPPVGRKRSHSVTTSKPSVLEIMTPMGVVPCTVELNQQSQLVLPNYTPQKRKKKDLINGKNKKTATKDLIATPSGYFYVTKKKVKPTTQRRLFRRILSFLWGWKRDEKSEIWLIRTNLSSNPSRAIYYSYEFRARYFKILILIYKLFLVGVSISLYSRPIINFSIVIGVHAIFLVFLFLMRPYIFTLESTLHISATLICIVNTIYALILAITTISDYFLFPVILLNGILLLAIIIILFLSGIVRLQFTWKYQTLFRKTRKFEKHISQIGFTDDRLADKYANVNFKLTRINLNIIVNFFMIIGFVSIIAMSLCIAGLIRHEFVADSYPSLQRSNFYSPSLSCDDYNRIQFAGYSSWEEFTNNCCCSKSDFYNESLYSNRFSQVEIWHCKNGEMKERVRVEEVDGELNNGFEFRDFCSQTFKSGYDVNSCGFLTEHGEIPENNSYNQKFLW